jgi:hypothetical protein
MPPLGRETFTPLVKDKSEQSEENSLSLNRQPLSPLDKEKCVETENFKLPQELKDKIFQTAEDRSQGLLIKLQQYFFDHKVTIPGLSSHITDRYLGNQQSLLFQFVQIGINLDICSNPLPIPIESMTPITVKLLLDYGMISQIWVLDKTKHNDNQDKINSIINMKLLEMDRVKAVWNKYATNKIIVTIIKSENN